MFLYILSEHYCVQLNCSSKLQKKPPKYLYTSTYVLYVTLKIDVGNKLLTETMRVLLKRKS